MMMLCSLPAVDSAGDARSKHSRTRPQLALNTIQPTRREQRGHPMSVTDVPMSSHDLHSAHTPRAAQSLDVGDRCPDVFTRSGLFTKFAHRDLDHHGFLFPKFYSLGVLNAPEADRESLIDL